MILKPITTEKAVKMIDIENTLTFEVGRLDNKDDVRKEVEKVFNVKIERVRSLIRKNKKIVYVKLNKKNPAIDVATKIGMI